MEEPLPITCAYAVSRNSKNVGLNECKQSHSLSICPFDLLQSGYYPNVGSQGENHRAQQKNTQTEAGSASAVPPLAPLLYYRVIKHSFLSQASPLITQ